MAKTESLNEVSTVPEPIKSAEDILKAHREVLEATIENAKSQVESARESFHRYSGALEIAQKALDDLDGRMK